MHQLIKSAKHSVSMTLAMLILCFPLLGSAENVENVSLPPATLDTANAPLNPSDDAPTVVSETSDTATDADLALPTVEVKDPYEHFNRSVFIFNDKIDTYFMRPIAEFYNHVMPKPINKGIHNFFNNIDELPTIANDILQLQIYQLPNDLWRFTINSTLGIFGFIDIATGLHLPYYKNDFGLTLNMWGYKKSDYVVIPFWGPHTIRDGIFGLPVDYFLFSIYPHVYPRTTRYGLYAVGVLDNRAQLLKFQSVLDEAAYDKYIFVRNAYLQNRQQKIEQNQQLKKPSAPENAEISSNN